jgi:transposase
MKQHYKITNWAKYNRSLIDRGNIFLYFTANVRSNWHNGSRETGGRPRDYSAASIELFLMLRTLLKLPLRRTQGFMEGLLEELNWNVRCPNYSLVCRRAPELKNKLERFLKSSEPIHVLVDSSGLKIFGEGEWKMRTHGKSKRRTWRKIHIGVDRKTKAIVTTKLTKATVGDSSVIAKLLDRISNLEGMTGDGAYDANPVYAYLNERKASAIIPPDENAVVSKRHSEVRNNAVEFIKNKGDNDQARKIWKKNVGYYQRSNVENAFFRLKTIFDSTLHSRRLPNQEIETLMRCHLLNRMTQIGMPISVIK